MAPVENASNTREASQTAGDASLTASGTSQVALITGGATGIGLACARALDKQGHKVAVTYRNSPPPSNFFAARCDITSSPEVDSAFTQVEDALGPPLILVCNAGINKDNLVMRMKESDFTEVLDANLTGTWRVTKRSIKSMSRARYGRIVFISSVVGLGGNAGQANYAASKAGLVGLARSLAKEYASRNITVNVLAPGPIETNMIASLNETQRQAISDLVPMRRNGTPQEVAAAVEFLTSPQASYITGAILPVDGGMSMG